MKDNGRVLEMVAMFFGERFEHIEQELKNTAEEDAREHTPLKQPEIKKKSG